VDHSPEWSSCL